MKRHWNSVFCQPKPASLSFPRSRSVVFWLPQTKTFIPYSGLLARSALLAAGGPLVVAAEAPPPGFAPEPVVGLLVLLPDDPAGVEGFAAAWAAALGPLDEAGAAGAAAVAWPGWTFANDSELTSWR